MVTVSRSFSNSLVLSLIGKLLTSSEEKNAYKINKNKFWVGLGLFVVLNATFNNISVISWRSVLLVEET
jgi:hypothetical protein